MKLYVHTECDGTVCVEVDELGMIREAMQKIEEHTGDEWLQYILVYQNIDLPDDYTVPQCGLYDGCMVKWRRPWWITVVTRRWGVIQLDVWRDATVSVVKGMVENLLGISVSHHVLKYQGVTLSDECTIESCGVLNAGSDRKLYLATRETISSSSSSLLVTHVMLYVETEDHGTVCMEVTESDYIGAVMENMREVLKETWHYCSMVYNNTVLPADHTVSQCGLDDGCSVKWRVIFVLRVVLPTGRGIPLQVWCDVTVREVKEMVEKKTRNPIAHQMLKFKDKELPDGCTMEQCGVLDDMCYSELHLVTRDQSVSNIRRKRIITKDEEKASCPVCLDTISKKKMQEFPCGCIMCKDCFKQNYDTVIKNNPATSFCCPLCSNPKIKPVTDEVHQFFKFLRENLEPILEENVVDIMEKKIMSAAMDGSQLVTCMKCKAEFTFKDQGAPRVRCPHCSYEQCYRCEEQWCAAHSGRSCVQYQQFKKKEAEGSKKTEAVENVVISESLACPSCCKRYHLSRGGCQHFTCTDCKHQFCGSCFMEFSRTCQKYSNCKSLGFHCHHPRNCYAELRNESPKVLERLLKTHKVCLDIVKHTAKTCGVMKSDDSYKETPCGKKTYKSTLCREHYVEYLVQKMNEHKIDPVELMNVEQLTHLLKKREKGVATLKGNNKQKKQILTQAIKKELPLEEMRTIKIQQDCVVVY